MKFSYTALTGDNKQINGVLDVENEAGAQAELHKMEVAILSLKEISEEDYEKLKAEQAVVKEEKGIQTYTFVGIDKNGQEAEGTIDALDPYAAYKRLRTEYQFKVNNLYLSSSTPEEIEYAKALVATLEQQMEQEGVTVGAELGTKAKEKSEQEEEELSAEEQEMKDAVMAEIDKVIINTKKVLEEHKELFTNDLIKEIEATLGDLERIRTSNNYKHITEVSNNLYTLISNPDKVEDPDAEGFHALVGDMGDSALVKKEFDLYSQAVKIKGVKKIFSTISEKLQAMTAPPDEEGEAKGLIGKIKSAIHKRTKKINVKKPPKVIKKERKPKGKFGKLMDSVSAYFGATSPVLKNARKKQLKAAFAEFFGKGKKKGAAKGLTEEQVKEAAKKAAEKQKVEEEKKVTKAKEEEGVKGEKKAMDLTGFFVEVDSFIAWLLCFYIIYFFLVGFSIEKNVGLSRDFVFQTMKSPLILNITILLLIAHFTLRLKNLHFQKSFFGALFLLFLSVGFYTLLIVNF
jgi:hypothetical protein